MAVVTYNWVNVVPPTALSSPFTSAGLGLLAIASNAAGTRFFATWNTPGNESVVGRAVSAGGSLLSGENVLNTTGANQQFDSSVAGLNNGNFVVSYTDFSTDPGGDIRFRLFNPAGVPLADDVNVFANGIGDRNSDVAALSNGGFAIAFDRDFGGGDVDIRVQLYNANGTANGATIPVDSASALNTNTPSVTGLAGGGFVVAWTQQDAAGANPTGVWFQRYNASGVAQGGHVPIPNADPADAVQVQGLPDGGFVVAYRVDKDFFPLSIFAQVFNADGTARSTPQFVAQDIEIAPPEITFLSNGFFVVTTEGNVFGNLSGTSGRAFDADGNPVGAAFTSGIAVAALAGGLVAGVRYGPTDILEPGTTAIRTSVNALVRTTTGGAGPEVLGGDDLRDVIIGGGSADTLLGLGSADTLDGGTGADALNGGDGDDILIGGAGGDTLIGGPGSDTASYVGAAARVKVALDNSIVFEGDALGDTFNSIARLIGTGSSDILIGDLNGNIINGGSSNDTIRGQAGNDILRGDKGGDNISGGLGDDKFSFLALDQAGDLINDFTNAVGNNDIFNFKGSAFGGLPVGALAANRFLASAAGVATTANHRFIYETDTGILRFDANGSVAGGVTVIATLTGAPVLTLADFAII